MTMVKTGSKWDLKKKIFCCGMKIFDTVWEPFVNLTYFVQEAWEFLLCLFFRVSYCNHKMHFKNVRQKYKDIIN